jgi:hypothetical protein
MQERKRAPFPHRESARAFNSKWRQLVAQLFRQTVDARLPPENNQRFYHGRGWTQRRADGSEMTTEVKAHRTETVLRFDDVIDAKLSAVVELIRSIVEQMEGSLMRTLFETVCDAVEQVGNVVSANDKPTGQAILEALRKIEFGVNRKGEVTWPELYLHPDQVPKFLKAAEETGPELQAEIDRVTAEKVDAARAREAERKARFKRRSVA